MANRFLNNITINDAYTLPLADGTAGQAITTDGAGNLAFSTVDSDSALRIALRVKNVSGSTLSAGTLVRVAPSASPPSGNVLEVNIADNSSASTMPAIGIITSSLANEAEGDAVAFGRASGFSTIGFTEGDPVWVGSNGALTGTKPIGSNLIQKVGQVIKVDSSNGSIEVFGAGRTNDVPNLSVGKIWVGTTTNTAESTLVEIDETNNILTVGGKIYYSNVFDQEADLPSATTYHGMFAHVHGTGYAYYAHAGLWVKLARHDELVAAANDATITLTAGTGLSGGGDFTTDQATNETITVNLADTAVTPGTYGDADNTPQITIDQQGRITSATTIPTAGAGGGGAGGSMSAEINQYTGNGTTDAFSLTTAATDDDAVQVYLDGVYQVKTTANYSISGSTVTFVDPPTSGTAIEFVHFVNTSPSSLINKTFTASGTTADFDLVDTVPDENYTFVFIQGVYQEKSTYSITGSTLTFTTTPLAGYSIEVMIFGAVSLNNSGGISWDTDIKVANFGATAGAGYFVNTTSAAITVTLPSSPSAGDEVSIVDYAGTADTNNITITSSDNINGASNDVKINYERGGVSMVYVDATQGWIAYNANNETADALIDVPLTITVDYLVIAGGGGAGGYDGSAYRVGTDGENSTFSSITSTGGGRGGVWNATTGDQNGGSGGGAAGNTSAGNAVTTPVTQGNDGGIASDPGTAYGASGGGGGAGTAGGNASGTVYGSGGTGLAVNILNATNATSESVGEVSGSDVYYSGGGAAGGWDQFGQTLGSPGLGGGGAGGLDSAGGNGTPNTGGGGGAGDIGVGADHGGGGAGGLRTSYSNSSSINGHNESSLALSFSTDYTVSVGPGGSAGGAYGGSGGSGVVILRYPIGYTISETTSPTVLTFNTYTEGSDKVTVFTSGENGTIQFTAV